ncbi:unnamed protein product [Moneuplotes crassus]|uniref:Uncharacterized protein n=1 Tax=Euplotes crassus TaxID=5936 RepID=A0AAD1U7R4_EUPCR|nr:unnamed protein product [Moneuplotes crassus]
MEPIENTIKTKSWHPKRIWKEKSSDSGSFTIRKKRSIATKLVLSKDVLLKSIRGTDGISKHSFLNSPKKNIIPPVKFDKQLGDSQGFMNLRKRSQYDFNTVTCEAENSLSSGRNCSEVSKRMPKLACPGKLKKIKVLKNTKFNPRYYCEKGGLTSDKKVTIRLSKKLKKCKINREKKRNSMEFDSSSTESRSTKNELSQEERKGSLKLIRPVKSIDLTSRKSSQSQNLKAKIEISSANSFTSIPNPLGTPLKTNTQKPPLPKKQIKRSRISEFSFSKSHSFNSSTSKGRSKISINTLCLTPKTKHKLSLSPHRKILKRRSTCTKKLLQSL